MDDQNKNNDDERERGKKTEPTQERTSYYYSYGPFKSSSSDEYSKSNQTSSMSETAESSTAQVTQPRPVHSYESQQNEQRQMGTWAYPTKKKSSFRSIFASFLAGVIIMGSLMIASDKMDLFTNNDALSGAEAPISGESLYLNTNGSGEGEAANAAMAIVRPDTIADIVNSSSPAVVKIETVITQTGRRNSNSFFNDDFFRDFFGDNFQSPPTSQDQRISGMGSGFIFEKNGYILTNEHVISGADEIYVTARGYTKPFKAKLLGSDYDLDLAVLKIEGDKPFGALKLGDSSDVRVGDWLTAIGNPIGFDHTVSVGVLSATEREINIADQQGPRNYQHLLQTDASINPGNSGGPLLNLKGEVIGINTAVSAQAQGIGFAIPTSTIVEVLDQLKNNKVIPKPYIGVYLTDIDETWQENLNLGSTNGALITQLEAESPASRAGLRPGDVVLKVNNTEIDNSQMLSDKIKEVKIGEKVVLEINRDGKKLETVVIVGDRNSK